MERMTPIFDSLTAMQAHYDRYPDRGLLDDTRSQLQGAKSVEDLVPVVERLMVAHLRLLARVATLESRRVLMPEGARVPLGEAFESLMGAR